MENIRRGLIDRNCSRIGCRVCLFLSDMKLQGFKFIVFHRYSLFLYEIKNYYVKQSRTLAGSRPYCERSAETRPPTHSSEAILFTGKFCRFISHVFPPPMYCLQNTYVLYAHISTVHRICQALFWKIKAFFCVCKQHCLKTDKIHGNIG